MGLTFALQRAVTGVGTAMSMTESVAAGERDRQHGDAPSRRWKLLAGLGVLLLFVGLGVWWVLTTPKLGGGFTASVSSADHNVVWASGLRENVYVVPADGRGSSTLAFGIHNDGPLAVELVDVWPSTEVPTCMWQASERWFQDDPRYMTVLDDRARPATGAVLAPGTSATVWITGAHPDPDGCVHAGLTLHDDVEVIVRTGARTSTKRVPLGYTFGYSDDPDSLRASYVFRVLPPTSPSDS